MLFNDPVFLFIFLPGVLLAAMIARRLGGARAVLALLIAVSLLFYSWWSPLYLPLLGALAAFNYLVACAITAARERTHVTRARLLLAAGIGIDLLALAYFKYANFLIGTADVMLGRRFPMLDIILPLGISFFTFQKIAYLVDTSRGETGKHDFLEYCFFVMFFPQLIAGPIVHHSEIFSQLRRPGALAVAPDHVAVGLSIFLIGLFKKVIIADHLAPVASGTFEAASLGMPLHSFYAWQGATAYALQLYFDFSGYSDMAIGAARLFGIQLPLNFHSPYQATGIIDFWRRWHMTLSRFLRDYLYFPLGGNRKGKARRYVNLMLTMTIGGLWHGASWNFVLWGFLHGLFLVVNHGWRALFPPIDRWWSRGIARLITLVAVILAFVPFRAPDLTTALHIYASMAGATDFYPGLTPSVQAAAQLHADFGRAPETESLERAVVWGALFLGFLWLAPNTQQLMMRFRPAVNFDFRAAQRDPSALAWFASLRSFLHWRPSVPSAALLGIAAGLAVLGLQHVSEFLYFEF